MKALLVDAYDSFVYTIYQYLLAAGVTVKVMRNNQITPGDITAWQPDFLVLGPGPGHPAEAHYVELIQQFSPTLPILGVCLGHQAIGLAFGGQVIQAKHLMHGKSSLITHDQQGCFRDLPSPLKVTRYHSLIVDSQGLPNDLIITAQSTDDQYVMGLRHKTLPIESIQFHPESIGTEYGMEIFRNFIVAISPASENTFTRP